MPKKTYSNPRDRFLAVAESRTNAVLDKIRVLGHCSNKQLYQYNQDEVAKIFKMLEEELRLTKQKFLVNSKVKRKRFRL